MGFPNVLVALMATIAKNRPHAPEAPLKSNTGTGITKAEHGQPKTNAHFALSLEAPPTPNTANEKLKLTPGSERGSAEGSYESRTSHHRCLYS